MLNIWCRGELCSPKETKKFYIIYGNHLANKHLQTCRAGARLPPKTMKIDVIYGGYQFSAVGVDVLDAPITYCAAETALRHQANTVRPYILRDNIRLMR